MAARANHWRHAGWLLAALTALTGCHPLSVVPSYRFPPPQAALPSVLTPEDAPSPQPSAPPEAESASPASPDAFTDCDSTGEMGPPCTGMSMRIPLWLPALPKLPRIPLPGETPDEAPWPRFHPVPTRPVFEPPPEDLPLPNALPLEPLPPKRLTQPPAPLPAPPVPSSPAVPLKSQ